MKKLLLFLTFSLCLHFSHAQAPEAFKYQAVVRDVSGNVLANRNVAFRINILQGTMTGAGVYIELHSAETNDFGLISLDIGTGAPVFGVFQNINWATDKYFIKVELDTSGGSDFQVMGVSQLASVPYALYAKNAENGFSGDYNDLSNKPLTDGSETKITAGANVSVSGNGTNASPYVINAAMNHFPGELLGGGVVFYVDPTGQHGQIVSMIDIGINKWSNVNDSIGVEAKSPWNGQENTNAIIKQAGHNSSAAKLCADYSNADYGTGVYSDWYLPAINQLSELYFNIYEVNKTLINDGNNLTTAIYYKPYWSSTESWNIFAGGYAYFFNYETCTCDKYSKSNPLVVRAIRSF